MPLWLMIPGYIAMLPYMAVALLITLPFYGIEKIRWSEGCIEIVAKRRPNGGTRIWGNPGAQTIAFLIAHASVRAWGSKSLRVHERIHVWQGAIISLVGALAYLSLFADGWWPYLASGLGAIAWPLAYGIAALVSRIRFGTWYVDRTSNMTRETRGNIFERHAYRFDREFEQGKHPGAWGYNP